MPLVPFSNDFLNAEALIDFPETRAAFASALPAECDPVLHEFAELLDTGLSFLQEVQQQELSFSVIPPEQLEPWNDLMRLLHTPVHADIFRKAATLVGLLEEFLTLYHQEQRHTIMGNIFHRRCHSRAGGAKLIEAYTSDYLGPALAFPGEFDDYAEEIDPLNASPLATRAQRHPEQQRVHELRNSLVSSCQKAPHSAPPSVSDETDSQLDDQQEPSPLRELPKGLGRLTLEPVVQQRAHSPPAVPVARIPAERKYVPPGRRMLPSKEAPTLPTNAPIASNAPYGYGVHCVEDPGVANMLKQESDRLLVEPQQFQGTPTFEDLVHLKNPTSCMSSLVTGEIDGISESDPASPSAPGTERYVNYSGNSTSKYSKAQMRRLMFVPTLGESSEFQYTPLQHNTGDIVQDGSSLRVRDNIQFPSFDRYTTWCRKMVEEWETIRSSGYGIYAPSVDDSFRLQYRSATLVITRFEFLRELCDYVRSEWPELRFEATYTLITSHYLTARWSKYPYKDSQKEDRTLLRLGMAGGSASSRRDDLHQYVMENFPHLEFGKLLSRLNLTGAGGASPWFPWPGGVTSGALPPSSVLGNASSSMPPSNSGAPARATPTTRSDVGPCPLCGGAHSYRAGAYNHPAELPILRTCNRIKTIGGVRKKCIVKHAFSGPLITPCDFTETVA
ncbi:hypothetical protein CYMTET_42529 [Cymbomonas tetramitiformis]|uniref:Uncharacterized protein n=1 Tax=Cymbomonas tetramitiformis TaxID=36881 RepID=A0AAE0C421_9CHLO|nr:hypothetical protein CYMTET_42529 [Cymbomonas tetramitiformis]